MAVDVPEGVWTREAKFVRRDTDDFAIFGMERAYPKRMVAFDGMKDCGQSAHGGGERARKFTERVEEDVVDGAGDLVSEKEEWSKEESW